MAARRQWGTLRCLTAVQPTTLPRLRMGRVRYNSSGTYLGARYAARHVIHLSPNPGLLHPTHETLLFPVTPLSCDLSLNRLRSPETH